MLTILYIVGFSCDGTEVYMCIKYKLHLIEGLKANILIGNNIFYIDGFLINFVSTFIYIQSCGVDIIINIKHHTQYLKRKILANVTTFILPKSKVLVFFK